MLALMQEISPKGFQSDSQVFRFSLPRGADGQDLHEVFVYMKKRGTVEKLPQNQIVWTEPQAPAACLLYKLDCALITEKKLLVLYLGHIQWEKCVSLMFSSQDEITANFPTAFSLVLKALQTIIKGRTFYFIKGRILG